LTKLIPEVCARQTRFASDPGITALPSRTLVFDWTDACLSHPFFDLMTTFFEDEATQARLCRAYLECWSEYETPERLSAAWALARPLCALPHAVRYRAITASIEPRTQGEFAGDTAAWLRRLLQFMPEAAPGGHQPDASLPRSPDDHPIAAYTHRATWRVLKAAAVLTGRGVHPPARPVPLSGLAGSTRTRRNQGSL
jgi:hypothetical protein